MLEIYLCHADSKTLQLELNSKEVNCSILNISNGCAAGTIFEAANFKKFTDLIYEAVQGAKKGDTIFVSWEYEKPFRSEYARLCESGTYMSEMQQIQALNPLIKRMAMSKATFIFRSNLNSVAATHASNKVTKIYQDGSTKVLKDIPQETSEGKKELNRAVARVMRREADSIKPVEDMKWGTFGENGWEYAPIESLTTEHLENILVTQAQLKPAHKRTIIEILKTR